MKPPKTLSGYLLRLKQVANIELGNLKGYDALTDEQKSWLGTISADIDNAIGEFEKSCTEIIKS